MSIPRPEHPRPQFARAQWLNLNGAWAFQRDPGRSGRARGLAGDAPYDTQITVPFCPESRLSGVTDTDFLPAVWYRRAVTVPDAWAEQRVLLHFGAVDYDCEVWVNGVSAGTHRGGYVGFTFDITALLHPGENVLTVCAEDDTRSPLQPTGKQSKRYASYECMYTRTTGIWQTVWLEPVPRRYLGRPRITPDLENGGVDVEVPIVGDPRGLTLEVAAFLDDERMVAQVKNVPPTGNVFRVRLTLDEVRPWSPESPTLYRLGLVMSDGKQWDVVSSYFGLRSITLSGPAVLLNGKPVFQRLILDQGFYPEGIYTAPSDAELRADIERSMAMGFNGARLHQKVFEERFLYWADKLGYLVWGEMASWGLDLANPAALERFQTEWLDALARDYSHPSLVGWCPFNETSTSQNPEVLRQIYRVTKALDPTRPVIDTSGYVHVVTDVYDVHDYEQDPAVFAAHYDMLRSQNAVAGWQGTDLQPAPGQPYFVSEYGGIWWNPGQAGDAAWGYGNRPQSAAEFIERFRGLAEALLRHPAMCALCYTQLTDVEQEVNGLYTYDRQPKFPPEAIKAIMAQKAAIEEG